MRLHVDTFIVICLCRYLAHVLFSNPATAQEAVTRLHAHVFKSALLSVTLKKRMDGLAKAMSKKASISELSVNSPKKTFNVPAPAPSRASRLIVRNLPFDITEQDLRAVFLPYGPIHSIDIPLQNDALKMEDKNDTDTLEDIKKQLVTQLRTKGYAFVWMLSKKDAEKALEGANGMRVHAGMADGMVRDKQKRKKLRREEAKLKQKEKERKARESEKKIEKEEEEEEESRAKEEEDDVEDEDAREDEEYESGVAERVIAVDWALSKDKWEEAKAKLQKEAKTDQDIKEESDNESGDDEDEDSGSEDEEDSHVGLHEYSDNESGPEDDGSDEGMDVDGEDQKLSKPQLPPPETGTTLFVRNVPYEATEDELRTVCVYMTLHTHHALTYLLDSVPLGHCGMPVSRWIMRQDGRVVLVLYASGRRKMQTGRLNRVSFFIKKPQERRCAQ